MKKYLSMLAVLAVAASAFGQGLVNFSNNGTTLVKLPDGTSVPKAGGFVQLLWAPANTAGTQWDANPPSTMASWLGANPGWLAVASPIKSLDSAGRFLGGQVILPTAAPGAPVQLSVAGWTGNHASFDAAFAAGANVAIHDPFTVTTGNPNTTPAGTPALITGAGQFTGLTLVPVPEPSTLALAGLGAAALLIFRRRK